MSKNTENTSDNKTLQFACELLKNGISVLPLNKKIPFPGYTWDHLKANLISTEALKRDFELLNAKSYGIITGQVSGNLEAIDVDTKYDLTGTLWEELSFTIRQALPEIAEALFKSLVTTPSGGKHFYYFCKSGIEGNQKLANRPASNEELQENPKQKVLVLIETRGEGGYVVGAASEGYIPENDPFKIVEVSAEERNTILSICRSFNLVNDEPANKKASNYSMTYSGDNTKPWDDYNTNGDARELLERNGWTFVRSGGEREFYKRPGNTSSATSGNWHRGKRTFYCFSSSTELPTEGLSLTALKAHLEHGKDFTATTRTLLSEGWGSKSNSSLANQSTKIENRSNQPKLSIDELDKLIMESTLDLTIDEQPPPVIISILSGDKCTGLLTLGDFSLVLGKAKSRKTFFVYTIVGSAIKNGIIQNKISATLPIDKTNVVVFDTEQSKYHSNRAAKRALRLAGVDSTHIKVIHLRKFTPRQRVEMIIRVLETTPNLALVVIDGIRDLVSSINDEEQATELMTNLLSWSENFNIHILCVLHENKGNSDARGHIGTEGQNKASVVLTVTKDSQNPDLSIVDAKYSRDLDFEPFAFSIDDSGLPVIESQWELKSGRTPSSQKITPSSIDPLTHRAILTEVYSYNPAPNYSTLWKQIKLATIKQGKDIGDNKAKDFVQYYQNEGYIKVENTGKYAKYLLSL